MNHWLIDPNLDHLTLIDTTQLNIGRWNYI